MIFYFFIINLLNFFTGGKKQISNETISRRNHPSNVNRRTPSSSPHIKTELTINSGSRKQSMRFNSPRVIKEQSSYKSQKENLLIQQNVPSNSINHNYENVNNYKPSEIPQCKTPLIKKPLNVKTPKSAKSLSARRSTMNSRRTPLKAVMPMTPKRQSPRIVLKSTQLSRHMN